MKPRPLEAVRSGGQSGERDRTSFLAGVLLPAF